MIDKSLIKNKIPIDVVVPWVDGNDSKHKKKINSYFNDKDIARIPGAYSTRFVSVNEIKYCILSILKFAPFVRITFISNLSFIRFLSKSNDLYAEILPLIINNIFFNFLIY